MKNHGRCQSLILLQLMISLSAFTAAAEEIIADNGTNVDGKVILSETLVDRCDLEGSSNPVVSEDCIKKLTSDAKLGKAPNGDDYETQAKKILKEQTNGYMEIALNRLIESSKHKENSEKITGKDTGFSGDSRDDVEQIIKLNTDIVNITADINDSIALKNTVVNTESLYFGIIPILAKSMSMQEAENPDLRKTKPILPEKHNE